MKVKERRIEVGLQKNSKFLINIQIKRLHLKDSDYL